jgi:uncharacterized protein (TIGR02301 family)
VRRAAAALLASSMAVAPWGAAWAQHAGKGAKPFLPPEAPPAVPAPPPETKPYDAQLMRLAEIMGALTYMRGLCGEKDAEAWRTRMQKLLDAEGTPASRKDRLAGAYNKGLESYRISYRTCTPNAYIVIKRYLDEGERIAKEIENRYRAS